MRVGEGPLLTTYIKGRTLTNAEMAEKQKVAERRRKHPGTGITSSAPVTPVVEHETQDCIHVVQSTGLSRFQLFH